jgi:hypothetical protein
MPAGSGITESENSTNFCGFFWGTFFCQDTHWEKSRKLCRAFWKIKCPQDQALSFFCSLKLHPDTLQYIGGFHVLWAWRIFGWVKHHLQVSLVFFKQTLSPSFL